MSSNHEFTDSGSRKHVTKVAEGSYHFQFIRSHLNFTLQSVSSPSPCTHIIKNTCQSLESAAILMQQLFEAIAVDAVVDRQHMGTHLNIMQEVMVCSAAFTLKPLLLEASFHIKSLLTHSSSVTAMMTRSSA